ARNLHFVGDLHERVNGVLLLRWSPQVCDIPIAQVTESRISLQHLTRPCYETSPTAGFIDAGVKLTETPNGERNKGQARYFDSVPGAARKIASKFSRPADATARSTAFSAKAR